MSMSEPTEKMGEAPALASEYTAPVNQEMNGLMKDEAEPGDEGAQAPTTWSMLRELLETIVLALVIFLVVRQGMQNYRIESHSMQPNFYEGQFVLVNKLAYKLGEPTRGDVVVFRNPANEDEDYIKRVIGLPGDTIGFQNGEVYVNGELMDDSFTNPPTPAPNGQTLIVSPEHIFVMGDNRPNSRDSRFFGPLDEDLLVGKAWLRVWPFSSIGLVDHLELVPGVPLESETDGG